MITARGVGLALGGGALAAGGYSFGYPPLVAIGAAGVAAVAGAVLLVTWRPRLSVWRSVEPDRVQRGDDCLVTLHVRNTGRLRGGRVVAYDECTPRAGAHRQDAPAATYLAVALERLRPGAEGSVRYGVPTARRGVLELGPLRVGRRDPFGLAATEVRYGEPGRVWVHPKVHAVRAVPVGVTRSLEGRLDAGVQGNLTFHALREYVMGDDLRHVHWRTSARVGDLMVREHVDTSLPRLAVLLDDAAAAHTEESFEAAVEAAASVVVAALREGLQVSLYLTSGAHVAGAAAPGSPVGAAARTPYLDLLAEAEPRPADVRRAIDRVRRERLGDTLVYLTGSGSAGQLGPVAALRGVYPSIVVGVLGAAQLAGASAPGVVTITASDGAEFASRWDGVRGW